MKIREKILVMVLMLIGCGIIAGCGKDNSGHSSQDRGKKVQGRPTQTVPKKAEETTITASPGPSVDQIRQNLDGQSVTFKKGWMIYNPGDSLEIEPDSVRDIQIRSTARAGDTISVNIRFEFVGMILGGENQWLKASGQLSYRLKGTAYEFVKFFGVYPPEPEAR